ncbi:MAG: nickel-dependent lactate racemase [Nitrospirae bacterium]|nr:nickel-dependent lactate racemase [Nitrospirota bacterium]
MRIRLRYGRKTFFWEDRENRTTVLAAPPSSAPPLTQYDILQPSLDEFLSGGRKILVVAPDVTRPAGLQVYFPLLLRRAAAAGIPENRVSVLFANGLHRPLRPPEMRQILGLTGPTSCSLLNHDCRDATALAEAGTSPRGIRVEINRSVIEADRVILTGTVAFHYLAGMSGGWKIVAPGVASEATILDFHRLTLDEGDRVDIGLTAGNPFFEEISSLGRLLTGRFYLINTVLSPEGRPEAAFSGPVAEAHARGCAYVQSRYRVPIAKTSQAAVVSTGGYPRDLNLIQAHKALASGLHALRPGGALILLAECGDGFGIPDFLQWFSYDSPSTLLAALRKRFHPYGRTAWSIMRKAESHRVLLVSSLRPTDLQRMGIVPCASLRDALYYCRSMLASEDALYVVPEGSRILPFVPAAA